MRIRGLEHILFCMPSASASGRKPSDDTPVSPDSRRPTRAGAGTGRPTATVGPAGSNRPRNSRGDRRIRSRIGFLWGRPNTLTIFPAAARSLQVYPCNRSDRVRRLPSPLPPGMLDGIDAGRRRSTASSRCLLRRTTHGKPCARNPLRADRPGGGRAHDRHPRCSAPARGRVGPSILSWRHHATVW